jgi:nucleotidyltransferase substrate binding protein (TIGR01987 family)
MEYHSENNKIALNYKIAQYNESLDNLIHSLQHPKYDDIIYLKGIIKIFEDTFELSWKIMSNILQNYHGKVDFATGSPMESIKNAYEIGLIANNNWLNILAYRNSSIHKYGDLGDTIEGVKEIIEYKFLQSFIELHEYIELIYNNL